MTEENKRCTRKMNDLVRCPFWDCGWCYASHLDESECISLDKCKIKNEEQWLNYFAFKGI